MRGTKLVVDGNQVVGARGAAIASLDRPNDNERVAGWIARFLAG